MHRIRISDIAGVGEQKRELNGGPSRMGDQDRLDCRDRETIHGGHRGGDRGGSLLGNIPLRNGLDGGGI